LGESAEGTVSSTVVRAGTAGAGNDSNDNPAPRYAEEYNLAILRRFRKGGAFDRVAFERWWTYAIV
jgi:hypothetical protein